ncbi:MAG: hypothetical protein ACOY33_06505 [Pseudomonadota bacterium]
MKYLFATLGALVLLLLLWLALRPPGTVELALPETPSTETYEGLGPAPAPVPVPASPDGEPELPPELADIPLDPDAIASLRGGRVFGDPRTPPIERSAPREEPTVDELADPERYAEYEARQERKIKRAYVIEAEKYAKQLREDIEKGKAMGIPADEIAKVREKVRRIEEMRAKLLADDPQLLDPSSPVPRRSETPPPPGTDKVPTPD